MERIDYYKKLFQNNTDIRIYSKQLNEKDLDFFKQKFKTNDNIICLKCAYYFYKYNFLVNTNCPECNKPLQIQKISRQFVRKVSPGFCQLKCANNSNISKNKIKNTLIQRYNVENCSQLNQVKQKKSETLNKNFPGQKKNEIYNRIKQSYFDKTGYWHPMHNPKIRDKVIKDSKNSRYLDQTILEDIQKFLGKTEITLEDFDIIKEKSGISTSHLYKLIKKQGLKLQDKFSSRGEYEIFNFIQSFGIQNILVNSYLAIHPYQLDIYIPELKLGIEFNGDYWHQLKRKPENYHLRKTNLCESKGIRLIHIWEHEWASKKEFIKTLITLYLQNKVAQNAFQELLELFNDRLPRDYFQILDFPNYTIEEPIKEKLKEFEIKRTGYLTK